MAFFNQNKEKDPADLKTEFAKFFGPLIPSFKNLKTAGHLISGLSEAVVLYGLADSNLPIAWKGLLISFSLVLTFLAVYIIEHGLSKTYSMWIRQIIRWKFGNKWFKMMFVILTIMVIPLLLASPTLSSWGGSSFIEDHFATETRSSTDSIELAYKREVHRTDSLYSIDSTRVSQRFQDKAKGIHDRYQGLINLMELKKAVNDAKAKKGHRWASSHADDANQQILTYQSQLSTELDTLETAKFLAIQKIDLLRIAANQQHDQQRQQQLSLISSDDEERIAKNKKLKAKWSYAMMALCGFAALMVVISITVIELYRAGAGQDFEQAIDEDKPSKLGFLFKSVHNRLDDYFWEKSKIITNYSRSKPSMQIRFNNGAETKQALETTKVSAVSVSETEAQIKELNRKIKSYEWKLRNGQGRPETANRNIEAFQEQINQLKTKL